MHPSNPYATSTGDDDAVLAIERLIVEYAYRLDLGDLPGVAALFAGARWNDLYGAEAVERHLAERVIIYGDGTPRTAHVVSNIGVDATADGATARSIAMVYLQRDRGAAPEVIGCFDYSDEFTRTDVGWSFRSRRVTLRFGDLAGHLRPSPRPQITANQRAATPAVYSTDHGAARVLTMDHAASMNGLSPTMRQELMRAFAQAVDDDVPAIVLTGAGADFCAGADVAAIPGQALSDRVRRLDELERFLAGWRHMDIPIIVATEGAVAGGGVSLCLAADVVISSARTRFIGGWLRLGLAPDAGALWWLVRSLGPKRTMDWLYEGSALGARDAHAAGVVSAVVSPGGALDAALERAEIIAALPRSARSTTKRLLGAAVSSPDLDTYMAVEHYAVGGLFGSDEHAGAVRTFLNGSR